MEKTLFIEATEDTPRIELDAGKGLFEISGRSLPENAAIFYKPVMDWFQEYLMNPNPETLLLLKLEYFNSASSRQIVDLLTLLEKISGTNAIIKIQWHYKKGDELIEERGLEMKEMTELPFELMEY